MNVREKKTAQYFEKQGCLVHTVSKPSHYGMSHDIFNLWDHIVVPLQTIQIEDITIERGETIYIQTKSRKQYGKDLDKYKDFPCKYKYIMIWEKKSGRYESKYQRIS